MPGGCTGGVRATAAWCTTTSRSGCPSFLALVHVVSNADTSYPTIRQAATVLDEIARLKRTDAIVCHVANDRISDRLLRRWGWEQHAPQLRGRNFIKRFYGKYPLVG